MDRVLFRPPTVNFLWIKETHYILHHRMACVVDNRHPAPHDAPLLGPPSRRDRKRIVWDEVNLESNAEYHRLFPPTMRIDEPKTPFVRDGVAVDDDGLDDLAVEDGAPPLGHHHVGAAGRSPSSSFELAVDDASRVASTWHDAEYNRIALKAKLSMPLLPAPSENEGASKRGAVEGTTVTPLHSIGDVSTGAPPPAAMSSSSCDRVAGLSSPSADGGAAGLPLACLDPASSQQQQAAVNRPHDLGHCSSPEQTSRPRRETLPSGPAELQLAPTAVANAGSESSAPSLRVPKSQLMHLAKIDTDPDALSTISLQREEARHEAEFKHMRKAVYRDEGLKFKALLAAAAARDDDDDEE